MKDRIEKIITISKNNGKFRKVFVPTPSYAEQLNKNLKYLNEILLERDKCKVNHAFLTGRNSVTNAMQHIGYRYCLQLDIEDFFDSITSESVKGLINDEVINLVFIDGFLKQGLPTSPMISNIAFIPVDQAILNFVKNLDENIVYTRYADDLTFSFNDIRCKGVIHKRIIKILDEFGF
ncbi:RNA-directed DNA polymerase, partial [Ursidibacter maritimus]